MLMTSREHLNEAERLIKEVDAYRPGNQYSTLPKGISVSEQLHLAQLHLNIAAEIRQQAEANRRDNA